MKSCFALVIVAFVVVCVNGQGIPTKKCPPGEHSVLYCPRKAGPTCDNPTVHALDGPAACGIPDCFCDNDTVRDLCTGECVELSKCPNKQ